MVAKLPQCFNVSTAAADGGTCAACTVVTSIVEQLVLVNNATVEQSLDKVCQLLPKELTVGCESLVNLFGPGDTLPMAHHRY